MRKRSLIIPALVLVMIVMAVALVFGRHAELTVPVDDYYSEGALSVKTDYEDDVVRISDWNYSDGNVVVHLDPVRRGKTFVTIYNHDEPMTFLAVYVHAGGIITINGYLGRFNGDIIIPICAILYTLYCFIKLERYYRIRVNKHFFNYGNIALLGLLMFLGFLLLDQLLAFGVMYQGIEHTIRRFMESASLFSFYAFPVTLIVSILVTISNIKLIRNEGRNWQNLLGLFLGVALLIGTLLPEIISYWLQWLSNINVHHEGSIPYFIEMLVEDSISIFTAYVEFILLATIIFGFQAARNIPLYNKDAIMILGCQIMPDGSLTPLLKGRADRAIEFARMQKKAKGKDIYFIPSGGKGDDEVMAEGEAVGRYLISQGIPEERIIIENRSLNTYENFKYSYELIKDKIEGEPKLAFSTTNYHVLRSGLIASEQGIDADGIGAKTKSYFWINAFIREFVATMYSERKQHMIVLGILLIILLAMVILLYLAMHV